MLLCFEFVSANKMGLFLLIAKLLRLGFCFPQVTRWLPDHLAAHCYGCDSAFWLASRKHHCR